METSSANSSSEEQQARKLMADADKKSSGKSGGVLSSVFGGSSSKLDEAIELYVKAGNLFKMAKNWSDAGICFAKSAALSDSADSKLEAYQKFTDASACFRKVDPLRAVECLKKAATIQTEKGRFAMAAKTHVNIAEIYESDLKDLDQAIIHYEKAADFFQGEEARAQAQPCLLKVAQFAANRGDYTKAVGIFEELAKQNAEKPLLKAAAKELFFKAALCHLCVDSLNCQHAMIKYGETFPAVQDTREFKLLKILVDCVEASDLDRFDKEFASYEEISRMDPWASALFTRVKQTLGDSDLT